MYEREGEEEGGESVCACVCVRAWVRVWMRMHERERRGRREEEKRRGERERVAQSPIYDSPEVPLFTAAPVITPCHLHLFSLSF